jgi:RimJ/RimL family protein N-acetyltransferase
MASPPDNELSGDFEFCADALTLRANIVSWDSDAFGVPVAQISDVRVRDASAAIRDYGAFRSWLDAWDVRIASARLPHDRLRESMFLEAHDFRFVEMVLHPTIENLQGLAIPPHGLTVTAAEDSDLPSLRSLAENVFRHERFHVDPRLDPKIGDLRYGRWVQNSLGHPVQRLLKIEDADQLVALFLVEHKADRSAYWHLTGVSPACQGRGYGHRVWQSMLRYHQKAGCVRLTTTISARNVAVLNLYAKLGFRFLPPDMTFHWVR